MVILWSFSKWTFSLSFFLCLSLSLFPCKRCDSIYVFILGHYLSSSFYLSIHSRGVRSHFIKSDKIFRFWLLTNANVWLLCDAKTWAHFSFHQHFNHFIMLNTNGRHYHWFIYFNHVVVRVYFIITCSWILFTIFGHRHQFSFPFSSSKRN